MNADHKTRVSAGSLDVTIRAYGRSRTQGLGPPPNVAGTGRPI
jgi:hypothetical protein